MNKVLDFCNITGESVKEYEGERKYIATGDVVDNKIISFEKVTYKNKPSRANQNVKVGDVLFAKMKDTQKVVIIDEDNVTNIYSTGFFVITPEKDVRSDYLYWLFNSNKFNEQKNKNCKGATQKALNNEGFSKILIKEIPSIKEQEKIVDKLNKVQEIIDIKTKQMEELDKLIKSQFVEMFAQQEFETKELKEIANIGSSKRIYANEYKESGVPFYRSKEIRELGTGLKPSIELFISKEKYYEVKEKYGVPKKDDILMAAIGATIGYMWIVDDSEFYYKDGNLILISLKDGSNSIYLRYCLENIIKEFKNSNASGSAQLAMTIEKVERFQIVIPPIELQNKFAEIVKLIDKQKFELQKSLDDIQNLQESLMNKYFN